MTISVNFHYGPFEKQNNLFLESYIDEKLDAFQKALYRHEVANPDLKIYNPRAMKQFADKYIVIISTENKII